MILGWVLTDRTTHHVWCGPGMRPIHSAPWVRVPRWNSRKDALAVAKALSAAIGLSLIASPLRTT